NARVIFVAQLNAPDRRWPLALRVWFGVLLLGAPVALSALLPRFGLSSQWYLAGLIAAELVGTLLLVLEPFSNDPAFDHRPGLALLVELARTWPTRPDGKLETWFLAAGANNFNLRNDRGGLASASSLALSRQIGDADTGRPTLIIKLFDPGLGDGIALMGPQ